LQKDCELSHRTNVQFIICSWDDGQNCCADPTTSAAKLRAQSQNVYAIAVGSNSYPDRLTQICGGN
jgi:hypothetical protein